jgi:DNA polymerase I-like protein with 3'-5' exonuclease and polymerase domains
MYCDWHCFWKEDARDWQNLRDFDSLFRYNCRDVCATFEVAQQERRALAQANLTAQFEDRMGYSRHVYAMMQRGVIRDNEKTEALEAQIEEALQERTLIISDAAGHPINPNSPPQVGKWLYDEARCRKPGGVGKAGRPTGDEELAQVAKWHPHLEAPINAVVEYRALASVRNNVLHAELDPDGRLRSSFMTTGAETFRLTSSKNNFGRGCNLLNITAGNKDKHIPNFRDIFTPPPGYGIFDCDLEKADVWVVAWEAEDDYLKQKLASGNLHKENAKDLFGCRSVADVTPEQYYRAKRFVHLTDYGGGARTCAIACGITVHESELAQRRWFAIHPGIPAWHKRYAAQLRASRTIRNAFGYRIIYFDRIDSVLKEALAWTPQSTVALVASKIHMAFDAIPGIEVFVQMYDSVAGYYPLADEERILADMARAKDIVVPYDNPLVIPMGLSTSSSSWGACKLPENERKWPSVE